MVSKRPKKRIKYVDGAGTPSVRWGENPDNPMSPAFIPLTERGENAKARWWAMQSMKAHKKQTHGVF